MFLLSLCYFDRLLRRSAAHCQCNLEICVWDFIFLECHAEFRMTFFPLHTIQLCFHIDRHQSIRDGHNACEYIVINAMFCITGALRCSKMFYVSENILAVDAGFKVSRAFLVEICGSSSFPFPLSTSRKQLDLSSNISDLSKAINLFFKNDKYHPILVNISFSKTLARKVLRRRVFRYN